MEAAAKSPAAAKPVIAIGVRELAAFVLSTGDLAAEFTGGSRAAEAIRLHQRIQSGRPADYRPEVAVAWEEDAGDFRLLLSGRIDGVFEGADPPVVEEIKTTRGRPEECLRRPDPRHWGQAKLYAFLYAAGRGLPRIDVQLTYARLETAETREARERFEAAELERFFEETVGLFRAWAGRLTAFRRARDASLAGLDFPYADFRPGQREMVAAVAEAIERGEPLFVQAATGIGKTMAALYPAVRALTGGEERRVFYLTARTTGKLAAEKALALLRARGLRIKSLTLTAKERICFHPGAACDPEECPHARGYYDRLPAARAEIFADDAWTREAVEETARRREICPFEFSLDLSAWSDLIVGDYNYAFDPRAYLRRFFAEGGGEPILLIDEAHNLVDRSREMFSAEIRKQPFLDLRRGLKESLPELARRLGRINAWMLAERKRAAAAGGALAEPELPEGLAERLEAFTAAAERWLEKNLKAPFRRELLERYFEAVAFLRVAERFDETYAACREAAASDLRVKLFCLDPSRQFRAALDRCRAALFFSATLAPADYFRTLLGCPGARFVELDSPFPPENLKVLAAARISTLYRHRERTREEIASAIAAFVAPQAGNYLVFFPSYEYLRLVRESLPWPDPATELIVQEPGMSEREREAFLARFDADGRGTLVGLAVMGGVFGEGIDLVGARLSGAVVVGVGLPAVGLERELIRGYFDARLQAGFEYAYVYPGLNRVLQAAGRVIRSERDRGAVLLIDRRYGTAAYRELLPAGWRTAFVDGLPELSRQLGRFWRRADGPN